MEEVASDNRTHMAAIGKEYQEMVNQLIAVRPTRRTVLLHAWENRGNSAFPKDNAL